MASSTDLHEAHALGGAGVLAALDGMTGKMTALVRASDVPYLVETALVDVQEVANKERKVPRSFIRSDGMGVTPLFERYARPLISGEISPIMAGGVPRHIDPLGGGLA
jgi:6-phosphofructokinase 1